MSNENLSFSQQGLIQLKRDEGAIEGLYNDASNYGTSGVGHLVHKAGKWRSFLLEAVRQNPPWTTLVAQSGQTAYLPQGTAFDSRFAEIEAAAVSLARGEIAKKKLGSAYDKLSAAVAKSVDSEAKSAIDVEAAALAQPVDVTLRADIAPFEAAVRKHVTVTLSPDEFDALVSFSFNVGAAAFGSSSLVKKINDEKHLTGTAQDRKVAIDAISGEFAKWNKSGGRVLSGLTARRAGEADRFLSRARNALATAKVGR
jgi:GH24 family phage-related lysozyme (muramidase)